MLATTELDLRMMDQVAWVTRVNRQAWMHEKPGATGATRAPRIAMIVVSIRRCAGTAVIHAGCRLLLPNPQPGARS